jgi:hypothetical protein
VARNNGKYLEDAISKELGRNVDVSRHWRRLSDTFAARNYVNAQPADFELCVGGKGMLLESKSQKGKTLRLKKFSQLPEMLRWAAAGKKGYVLAHFYELGEDLIVVDVELLDVSKPSWVLNGVGQRVGSIKEALSFIGWL